MERHRVTDGLVGAAIALAVITLVVIGLLWWISEPADDDAGRAAPRDEPLGEPRTGEPPTDLAEGETWLGDLVLDAATVATPEATLLDVQATGTNVLTDADGIRAGSLSVEATVPFEVVAGELGEGTAVGAEGSRASVTRTVEIAGRELRVVATGSVEARDGLLVVEPRSIDIGGPAFLADLLGDVVRRLVTIEHTIDGLPEGLVLTDVAVQEDGFRAALQGEDVRLVQPQG